MQIVTDRRGFLRRAGVAGVGAVAAPLVVRRHADAEVDPSLVPFSRGVASGDPLPDGVVLWTRLDVDDPAATVPVEWVVADDVDLSEVVARGTVDAAPDRGHCVKVDVRDLEPGTWYFYGFRALGAASITGRTKTAPAAGVELARFGVVSCSNYQAGFFNSYAELAERHDLDAILHLGDYLYEGGASASAATAFGEDRSHDPEQEILVLDDYRTRHGQYRLDPDLRRLHQLFPWITTWDDHESSNNAWRDGAGNHDPATDGDWAQRKAWAQQAYEEWLPIRVDDPGRIYRTLRYGDLVDVIVLDTRLDGRDVQLGSEGTVFLEEDVRDPARRMLSDAQRTFFLDELSASSARGTAWRVIAQQVMMAPLNVAGLPDLEGLLDVDLPDVPLFLTSGPAIALNPDQWDGYVAERERFYDHLVAEGIDDVVVLTGDIHTSWANDLSPDPYDPLVAPVGVEFVTTSVTSSGFEEILGSAEAARLAEPAVRAANPHIKYTDLTRRGFVVLDVRRSRVQADFHLFESVAQRGTTTTLGASWQTVAGANRLSPGSGESAPGPLPPATPEATPPVSAAPSPADPGAEPVDAAAGGAGRLPATGGRSGLAAGAATLAAAGVAHVLRRRQAVDGAGSD